MEGVFICEGFAFQLFPLRGPGYCKGFSYFITVAFNRELGYVACQILGEWEICVMYSHKLYGLVRFHRYHRLPYFHGCLIE